MPTESVSDHMPKIDPTPAPQTQPEAPPTPVPAHSEKDLLARARETLEYQIAGRNALVTVQGKLLTLTRWGLQKKLSLGSRVMSIVSTVTQTVGTDFDAFDTTKALAVLSHLSGPIMEIIAASISSPFANPNEAYEWLDQECSLFDLFNLACALFSQNFTEQGDTLGKWQSEMSKLGDALRSASKK